MLLKQLGFAATAAAFLIIPEVTEAEADEIYKTLPIDIHINDIPVSATRQTVELPCPKCDGQDAHLSVDFVVEDDTRLMMNGHQLYPQDFLHLELLTLKPEQLMGYSSVVSHEAFDAEQDSEIIKVSVLIHEIDMRSVDGVPAVDVKLIRSSDGEILIGNVEIQDITQPDCDDLWCRVKDSWDQAWKGLKSCHRGNHGGNHRGNADKIDLDGQRTSDYDLPVMAEEDDDYEWTQLLESVLFSIVLPVLAGIVAGMLVAVFAMGLGSFVAILVRSRRRRCRRADRRTKRASTEPAAEEEKAGLVENQDYHDPPPVYQDGQANNEA